MDSASEAETFLLLLLSDSNLPTGAFVSSQGLESAVTHGLVRPKSTKSLVDFIANVLESYVRSTLPFLTDTYDLSNTPGESEDKVFEGLLSLDALYDCMTMNHVAKRASSAQGVALLNLYTKGFSPPPSHSSHNSTIIPRLKLAIRLGQTPGHLPICFALLCNTLTLPLGRAQYLFLFLAARGLLSSAVRLNIVGPYAAQKILMYDIRPSIQSLAIKCANIHTIEDDKGEGAVMTWPLGEILATRHDLQHSRIFNS